MLEVLVQASTAPEKSLRSTAPPAYRTATPSTCWSCSSKRLGKPSRAWCYSTKAGSAISMSIFDCALVSTTELRRCAICSSLPPDFSGADSNCSMSSQRTASSGMLLESNVGISRTWRISSARDDGQQFGAATGIEPLPSPASVFFQSAVITTTWMACRGNSYRRRGGVWTAFPRWANAKYVGHELGIPFRGDLRQSVLPP